MEPAYPWRLFVPVILLLLGLTVFGMLNDSWLGFVASVVGVLALIGWFLFLRRRGHRLLR